MTDDLLTRVLDYADGRLAPADAAEVEAALASSPSAAAALAAYRRISAIGAPPAVDPVDESVLRRTIARVHDRLVERARATSLAPGPDPMPPVRDVLDHLAGLVLDLVMDSRRGAVALRAVDELHRVELQFRGGGCEIDLHAALAIDDTDDDAGDKGDAGDTAAPESVEWMLRGRLRGTPVPVAIRVLDPSGTVLAETTSDDDGRFTVRAPAGRRRLALDTDAGPIHTAWFELGG